jgi:hypothetical protein
LGWAAAQPRFCFHTFRIFALQRNVNQPRARPLGEWLRRGAQAREARSLPFLVKLVCPGQLVKQTPMTDHSRLTWALSRSASYSWGVYMAHGAVQSGNQAMVDQPMVLEPSKMPQDCSPAACGLSCMGPGARKGWGATLSTHTRGRVTSALCNMGTDGA